MEQERKVFDEENQPTSPEIEAAGQRLPSKLQDYAQTFLENTDKKKLIIGALAGLTFVLVLIVALASGQSSTKEIVNPDVNAIINPATASDHAQTPAPSGPTITSLLNDKMDSLKGEIQTKLSSMRANIGRQHYIAASIVAGLIAVGIIVALIIVSTKLRLKTEEVVSINDQNLAEQSKQAEQIILLRKQKSVLFAILAVFAFVVTYGINDTYRTRVAVVVGVLASIGGLLILGPIGFVGVACALAAGYSLAVLAKTPTPFMGVCAGIAVTVAIAMVFTDVNLFYSAASAYVMK